MPSNINRVVLTGNLTKNPELRQISSGLAVCKLRIGSTTRRKHAATGEWHDKANYFDVDVWGALGLSCHQYLARGRAVAIEGRLDWREWAAGDGSTRQAVAIIADEVQFLGSSSANGGPDAAHEQTAPAAAGGAASDDIPF